MTILFLKFAFGVWLLIAGSDWFTRAAALVTELTGWPRVLMGAVLIGLTTNLPEMAVSLSAVWTGHGAIALANPTGSNIVNTGLILGLCLVLGRGRMEEEWLRAHGIPMLFAALLLYLLALWGDIAALSGLILLGACAVYMILTFHHARRDPSLAAAWPVPGPEREAPSTVRGEPCWPTAVTLAVIGGAAVLISGQWVLDSSIAIARSWQISEAVIGLTLIAAGTSLPELATALSALRKGHHDTSLGIVLGSNIYNALGVVGLSGLAGVIPVTAANRLYDLPVMMFFLLVPFLGMGRTRQPGKTTGLVLVCAYGVYTYSLFTLYGIFEP